MAEVSWPRNGEARTQATTAAPLMRRRHSDPKVKSAIAGGFDLARLLDDS
jgi:hypothetical protein